ncbi:MAG: GH3 auxin-responsive promoter family protein [Acidobacteriota bacterium]|nr:GH3 auxin-responsive promoter family protein [Acidobacteriota bacterium]
MILSGLWQNAARLWARHRTAKQGAADRSAVLRKLLTRARNTRYGKQYGFAEILGEHDLYSAFSSRVPVIDYDHWVEWLDDLGPLKRVIPLDNQAWPGRIDTFCLSSGTTSGRTKYVPYSREMAAVNRRAAIDLFAHALVKAPSLAPPASKTLYMSGSTQIQRNEHGALGGDMSALTKYLSPKILESITLPPRHISDTEPWSARLEKLVDLCLAERSIGAISGIPIWQLTLLEAIRQKAGKPLVEVMPRLRLLIHGGMSIAPYRDRLRALLGDEVIFQEVYAASETGISAFTVPGEAGMRFREDYDVFYELEAPDETIIQPDRAQPGIAYALLVSSCAGLWRYRIGDRVVFRETDPLILDYVTRDKTTSTFDEKVTEKELELAMAACDPFIPDFSLGPYVPGRRHVWFLMTPETPPNDWLETLDRNLRAGNEDYDDYRGDGRIEAPFAVAVPDRGAFLKQLGREEGGQRKFPRLLSPQEVETLLDLYGHGRIAQIRAR